MEENLYCCFCGRALRRDFFYCPYCGSASRDTPSKKTSTLFAQNILDRIKQAESSLIDLESEIESFLQAKVS
ncbi:MAG: hypothetical protein CMN78_00365 [Spirochaetales bacterium]|nr:hypothetical protein [Spirochaetales bacterium]